MTTRMCRRCSEGMEFNQLNESSLEELWEIILLVELP